MADSPVPDPGRDLAREGVIVLGMHRGGTSATAGALRALGLSPGLEGGLKGPTSVNEAGFWEQELLNEINESLLERFGGSWQGPPDFTPGWFSADALEPDRLRAADRFREVFVSEPWVWKDPRNCLTLPFWLEAVDVRPVIVFVNRNPLEVARSLARRDGASTRFGLALWERYIREALGHCRGLPVLVTQYEDLVSDPGRWARAAGLFLKRFGIVIRDDDAGQLTGFLDPGLRHHRASPTEFAHDPAVSREQLALYERLERLRGAHLVFDGDRSLPSETPHTSWLLEERRRADRELLTQRQATLGAREKARGLREKVRAQETLIDALRAQLRQE